MLKKILIVVAAIVIIIFGGCFAIFELPQLLFNNMIHIPPDTKQVYEARVRYGAGSATRSIYYLSSTSIDDLSNWYKDYYPAFRSGDPEHRWLIAVKATDDKGLQPNALNPSPSKILIHESLCNYQFQYICLTVAMVDLSVQNRPSGYIVSDDGFAPQPDTPLYTMLDSLSKTGTLIIYRYYVDSW
jgi:hypothetical protein